MDLFEMPLFQDENLYRPFRTLRSQSGPGVHIRDADKCSKVD